MIDSFSGEYEFLSNFYPCKIEFEGLTYPSVEHAYQAAKTKDKKLRELVRDQSTPGKAKKIGRELELREDWEDIKLGLMTVLLGKKFATEGDLSAKLLNTLGHELVEGNWWGDTYWGVCKGVGENHLGKTLMKIRSMLLMGPL